MSRILRQSPRRGLRPLREQLNVDNVENTSPASSDADADPDVPVAQMKNIFEQTPKVRPPVTTPRHHQAPLQKNVAVQKRWGKDATLVKNRLEKTILGGVTDDDEKQVSPSLRQLRMTPGRALQKQKILERKHHEAKSRAHTLGIGGGISLWPQMENMRLTQREVAALTGVSAALVVGVVFLFHYLHGAVLDGLRSYNRQLTSFPQRNRIDPTGQEKFDKSVLAWHMAFTNLMDSLHGDFDTQWPKTLGMYQLCAIFYIIFIGLLLYYLADNMLTTSRLTPQRIKIWVSLLVVTGVWSILMMYLLVKAQQLETKVESTIHSLSDHLSDLVFLDLNLTRYKDVLMYWRIRCLPPTTTGTLSIMGFLQVRDVAYYLQYYSLPVLTVLLTPVVRLVLAVKEVYSTSKSK
ncbi:uncharacterized protein [Asterias amurensis]|uniref:uncharacterized protein n=1 Tax=Asterias amurensis TaxID=7602 RepID=UPI003AB151CD